MLTLDEVKTHLRVEQSLDDNYIELLISTAITIAEDYCNRAIVATTKTLMLDVFPDVIELPIAPVISIDNIDYQNTDDATQSFTDFYLNLRKLKATIEPTTNNEWPETYDNKEVVTISYQVGYSAIPPVIKHAILLIIGSLYEQRENHIVGVKTNKIPLSAEYLLNPYRIITV